MEVKTAGPTGSTQEMVVMGMALGGLVVLLGMMTIHFFFFLLNIFIIDCFTYGHAVRVE